MLDIRLELGRINYQSCVEAMLPPLVEHCAAKEHPGELDRFLAKLGTDAVPAACAVLDGLNGEEKDRLLVWLIMGHEQRLRNGANRHLAELFGGPLVKIGHFIALDRAGSRLSLLAEQVAIDYAALLKSPVVTDGVEQIGGDNTVLKGAAKLLLQMGSYLSPEALEKQGLNLLNSRRVKEKLMSVLSDALRQAGLDIELEDMVAELSTTIHLPQSLDGASVPDGYEKELMDALTAQVQKMHDER